MRGYVNFVEPDTPAARYFGGNLVRLTAVREKYDPDELMYAGTGRMRGSQSGCRGLNIDASVSYDSPFGECQLRRILENWFAADKQSRISLQKGDS